MQALSVESARARRRRRFLALAAPGVVALHAALLAAWPPVPNDAEPASAAVAVATPRSPVLLAAPMPPVPVPPPTPPLATPTRAAIVRPAPLPAAALGVEPARAPAPVAPSEVATETVAAAALAVDPEPAAAALPVYATQLPAAGRWRYRMQRGLASGEATLAWSPQPDGRYELRLEGTVAGLTVLDWASRGAVDAHGIAPERFAIRRRGRDNQAANFQRDAGKITFSGPTSELPLPPGVQDRLSWMLQLPAVIEAAPARFAPGARVALMVVGARGGADVWQIVVIGHERVGEIPALKLSREPRRPYDTRAEVWLDPARGHLPLRARLTQAEGGAALELLLEP